MPPKRGRGRGTPPSSVKVHPPPPDTDVDMGDPDYQKFAEDSIFQVFEVKVEPAPPACASTLQDDPGASSDARRTSQPRTGVRLHIHFSDQVEKDLVEWYKAHDEFYDKKLNSYKDTQRKNRLLEEKAASLDPPRTAADLKHFFRGMRTRYTKIRQKVSGKGAKDRLTERNQYILDLFRFLDQHIVKSKTRFTHTKFPRRQREDSESEVSSTTSNSSRVKQTGRAKRSKVVSPGSEESTAMDRTATWVDQCRRATEREKENNLDNYLEAGMQHMKYAVRCFIPRHKWRLLMGDLNRLVDYYAQEPQQQQPQMELQPPPHYQAQPQHFMEPQPPSHYQAQPPPTPTSNKAAQSRSKPKPQLQSSTQESLSDED